MGTSERRERERKKLREAILEAARKLFVDEGYEAVTMRKVAQKIEYSPTAIYFHFKDKEALFRELCTADFRALAREFQTIAKIADPVARLRATGRAYVAFALKHPNHYRLMFMTPHPPFEPDAKEIERGNPEQDAYAFLKATIVQAIGQKRFRAGLSDPELLAQAVWGGVHGVVSLHIAKCDDPWIDWRPVKTTAFLTIDALVSGLTEK